MAKTAFVDLSSGEISTDETEPGYLQSFLGGRGHGAALLSRLAGSSVEPLSPDNVLIFTAGLLAGSPWPTASRLHVTFKSPLTGAYGYANSGGHCAAELKRAGYDALVIQGRSPRPVFLRIEDENITIEDAAGLWGLTTTETQAALLGESPRPGAGRVAGIGPAGENLVRIAAIIADRDRAAARGGPGAVMGSKRLKAVHVRASGKVALPAGFQEAAKVAVEKLRSDPHLDGLRRYGTLVLMDSKNRTGDQPAKNHQRVQVPFIGKVNADAFDPYMLHHKGCSSCTIRCSRDSAVKDGPYAVEFEGPEYETTNALGPMCWVDNPEAILYANHLCNDYGLDTISTGVSIAFAMELHQRGLLDDDELSLEWGDEQTVTGLIERIAYRRGVGAVLAEGTLRAAQVIGQGAEQYAMQVKGMEMPRQEPRFAKGFGLGHSTSNRGADHLYGMPSIDLAGGWDVARKVFPAEIVTELMDPANEKYKPDMLIYGEHFCAVTDSLGICKFSTVEEYALFPEDLAPVVSLMLGREINANDLGTVGERIVNLERLYNVRHGFARKDDHLPPRFTTEPAALHWYEVDEVSGEITMSPEPVRYGLIEDMDAMLDRYYALRGWDPNGQPRLETVRRLGLLEYAGDVTQEP